MISYNLSHEAAARGKNYRRSDEEEKKKKKKTSVTTRVGPSITKNLRENRTEGPCVRFGST